MIDWYYHTKLNIVYYWELLFLGKNADSYFVILGN